MTHRLDSEGTRRLYQPLLVLAWEDPPRAVNAPSHAAVLFDIAIAASMSHHAAIIATSGAQQTGDAVLIYVLTAAPLVWNWWISSLFLCKFDSGDLFNEFILVIYMMCAIGQSILVEPCAACAISQNREVPCALQPSSSSDLSDLTCDSIYSSGENLEWPAAPKHCRLYILCSILPRVVHFLNTLRALREVQPRGTWDLRLSACELALDLPLWLVTPLLTNMYEIAAVWSCALAIELLNGLLEPAHLAFEFWWERRVQKLANRHLANIDGANGIPAEVSALRPNALAPASEAAQQQEQQHDGIDGVGGAPAGSSGAAEAGEPSPLVRVPIDVPYTEKRWHRLLMIALALLPSFTHRSYERLFYKNSASRGADFTMVSCLLAYGIKLFYFDVVDEWAGVERRQQLGIGVAREQQPKHPLHFQHGGGRWRANLWIGSHVFIIMSIGTVGTGVNAALAPWMGYPDADHANVLQTRALITIPLAVILWVLCIQHGLHVGGGKGTRRIGRHKRLLCRAVVALLIAMLPLLALDRDAGPAAACAEEPPSPPLPLSPPSPGSPPLSPPATTPGLPPPSPHAPLAPEPPPPPLVPSPAPSPPPFWYPPWNPVASPQLFLGLVVGLLVLQLIVELYGRGFLEGAERVDPTLSSEVMRNVGLSQPATPRDTPRGTPLVTPSPSAKSLHPAAVDLGGLGGGDHMRESSEPRYVHRSNSGLPLSANGSARDRNTSGLTSRGVARSESRASLSGEPAL